MLGWVGNDQPMKMKETSRGEDKKLHVKNNRNIKSRHYVSMAEIHQVVD